MAGLLNGSNGIQIIRHYYTLLPFLSTNQVMSVSYPANCPHHCFTMLKSSASQLPVGLPDSPYQIRQLASKDFT